MKRWLRVVVGIAVLAGVVVFGLFFNPWGESDDPPALEDAVAEELARRGESAAEQYREAHDDELSRTVRSVHPSVNDDGTPDVLVVVDEGVTEEQAGTVAESILRFLAEERGADFSRGYTATVFDATGAVLRRIDTTDCPRADNDALRCDPA
ncbi:hypothetical protein [Streptomyces sp. 7-21]|jgi:hypothetical protein|uniref:hypothetical protein n=1 Tax=Streptomyces sp. 7-21 TaxID=2802283 RepID=UPI00191D20E1|nr:hypothetical protein [Streptomyces sp. 7-21]MBL1067656.1 hypothetical protein [Streptomyces sp. 7-21]